MMHKKKLNSSKFAKRLGSYSHGYQVDSGDSMLIFTTGQIALDKNGQVLYPYDGEKQAEVVFNSLQNILKESGSSLDDVVKATIFLTDINDFAKISKIRNKYFEKSEPVSTLVEVNKLVKEGCVIEIEVIAIKKQKDF
ncbi:MAG: Translation initiation inhibitor [candidate division CPR3 bacterium GW2011_GWE2_35_7]|uniref:Translation initiation inhibitor n=1 Tax=candidate division CPR3 bacterium GW2011_GWF2_35_18 TaxID=1618350 RepID=A0A0G0BLS1_UNCC3|nr:MAG: Translation initiation inhibitor [candidate division CPR3 bacterium GW2011_GWF2_35_18]KKP86480.1 MAG: Translation initiation inhibitor [candidate division CPR3 bacterium GW2011_GWE2_35_7]